MGWRGGRRGGFRDRESKAPDRNARESENERNRAPVPARYCRADGRIRGPSDSVMPGASQSLCGLGDRKAARPLRYKHWIKRRGSQAAESRADFVHKMKIARKECRETRFFLNRVLRAEWVSQTRLSAILKESNELLKILTTIILRASGSMPSGTREGLSSAQRRGESRAARRGQTRIQPEGRVTDRAAIHE